MYVFQYCFTFLKLIQQKTTNIFQDSILVILGYGALIGIGLQFAKYPDLLICYLDILDKGFYINFFFTKVFLIIMY